jgi:uncharacterized OB-fold protein
MGLFSEIGRSVEQFKRTVESTANDAAGFECTECGERFHSNHEACPECNANAIRERDTDPDNASDQDT